MTSLRIGFRRHLRAEVVPDDATYLISEHGVTAVRAPHLESLAPLLDGSRDLAALLREAAGTLSPRRLEALIERLAEAGFIEYREAGAAVGPAEHSVEAYWELAGLDGQSARGRSASATVELRAVGELDLDAVAGALGAGGVRAAVGATPGAALTVVVCDDYLSAALPAIDAEHRAAGRPWLIAKPTGATVWVGPVFHPDGPCWSCLAHPLRRHRAVESRIRAATGRVPDRPHPAAGLPSTWATGLQLTAVETAKWLAGHRYPGQECVLTFDTLTLDSRKHRLRRRPQCPHCGTPRTPAATVPIVPVPRLRAPDAGGCRARSAERMLDAYGHLVSPITGVVAEVSRVEGGPAFLNSYSSGANPVGGGQGLSAVRAGLRQLNGGKGVTALDARVSALCESVERYSGCLHGDEPRIRASYRSLGERAVHPGSCQLYAPEQFADRAAWNACHGGFHHVPEPFDEDAEIDWTPLWSLTGQCERLLPTALLYFPPADDGVRPAAGREFCRADSNGNAAGTSLEDAVLQGFLELVERDAVALWWYNRTRQPAVDLDATGDLWTGELREVHRSLRREVWALDLTSDFGIPVFAALSRRTDKPAEDIVFGFGAHFDARIALRRAMTELNQLLPAALGACRHGDGYRLTDPAPLQWWRTATLDNQPHLRPKDGERARPVREFPRHACVDLAEDVAAVTASVRERGLELLVLDQTRPETELPVVKVLVPGLRSFWARFAPGRLFHVPVALGRLASPTPAADLNPLPLFV
ncbi:TOMM precursor leader peptide-binding protein [Streptomyces sp. BR1]|uniref:TOMM precursor leader peptide-binding protein n=1 Tax=Streptomyces sp. BR1 TaxID=1592323 RepID=UPI00402BB4A5